MALLNFLYRDDTLITSLYAQIFSGKLAHITTEETSAKGSDTTIDGNIILASGKAEFSKQTSKSVSETIEPHDAAILDILNYLQKFYVKENSKSGDIALLSGGMYIISYELMKSVIECVVEPMKNSLNIKNVKGISRDKLLSLIKNTCLGETNDTRFFFQSDNKWFWGLLKREGITQHLPLLQISYGMDLIPVKIIAVNMDDSEKSDVKPDFNDVDLEHTGFARYMHNVTRFANGLLAGNAPLSALLAPLVIVQELNAE